VSSTGDENVCEESIYEGLFLNLASGLTHFAANEV